MKLLKVDGQFAAPSFYLDHESGIYYVKRMINGKVIWKSTGHSAPKPALRRYNEIMKSLNDTKGGWHEKDVPTLNEWWTRYRAAKKKSPTTWRREDIAMNAHILPQIGKLGLDEITQNQIERYLNWRRKKVAEGTVTREHSLLAAVFNAAVDEELIDKSPLRKIHRANYKTRERVITAEEEDGVLALLSPEDQRWVTLLLGTGIRLDDLRKLEAEHVSVVPPTITLISGKGMNGEPKKRTVPLLAPVLVQILQTQVTLTPTGRLWNYKEPVFRDRLRVACKLAKVERFTPHNLRHTFATRYLRSGGDIYVLSGILGHASVEITERVYAHLRTADHAKLSQHVKLDLQLANG